MPNEMPGLHTLQIAADGPPTIFDLFAAHAPAMPEWFKAERYTWKYEHCPDGLDRQAWDKRKAAEAGRKLFDIECQWRCEFAARMMAARAEAFRLEAIAADMRGAGPAFVHLRERSEGQANG